MRYITQKRLSLEEMSEMIATFQTAYEICASATVKQDLELVEFWQNELLKHPLIALVRIDALSDIMSQILTKDEIKNFILNLVFRFYAMAGREHDSIERLCVNLSDGISIDGPDPKLALLSKDLVELLPSSMYESPRRNTWYNRILESIRRTKRITLTEVLVHNKIFVILLLLHLSLSPNGQNFTTSLNSNP